MIGVGLVGVGGFGLRLAQAIRAVPGLELVAVGDSDAERAAVVGRDLGTEAIADVDELVAHPRVHAVVVATPPGSHVPVGLRVVAARRHLFVEKPISITVEEGRGLIAAAERAGVTLLVGHVTRLLPVVRAALERIQRGDIGEPLAVAMVRHQDLPRQGWRARRAEYGTLLHSPAVHNLDVMNAILGRAVAVTAVAAPSIQDLEYPDTLALVVGYEAGRIGSLNASVSDPLFRPEGTNTVRVLGSRGALAFDIASGHLDVQPADGAAEHAALPAGPGHIDAALVDELANFAAAIRGETLPFVSPEAALAAVELCEAADHSVATRRTVTLPLAPIPAEVPT